MAAQYPIGFSSRIHMKKVFLKSHFNGNGKDSCIMHDGFNEEAGDNDEIIFGYQMTS